MGVLVQTSSLAHTLNTSALGELSWEHIPYPTSKPPNNEPRYPLSNKNLQPTPTNHPQGNLLTTKQANLNPPPTKTPEKPRKPPPTLPSSPQPLHPTTRPPRRRGYGSAELRHARHGPQVPAQLRAQGRHLAWKKSKAERWGGANPGSTCMRCSHQKNKRGMSRINEKRRFVIRVAHPGWLTLGVDCHLRFVSMEAFLPKVCSNKFTVSLSCFTSLFLVPLKD